MYNIKTKYVILAGASAKSTAHWSRYFYLKILEMNVSVASGIAL